MSRETMEMKMMRMMAWERAKGELNSMLATYNGGAGDEQPYHDMKKLMRDFFQDVELNGLHE